MIESAIKELQTISQFQRAYSLKEWSVQTDTEKEKDLPRLRRRIGELLTQAIRKSARENDPDQQIAAAILIAELSEAESTGETKDRLTRELSDAVRGLVQEKDVAVRQSALHALGKIAPAPADAYPLLKIVLLNDVLGPRRLAAYALSDLVKNIKLLDFKEQMDTIDLTVSTAALGLRDADESIRGYSLQAIMEAAKALKDYVESPGGTVTVEAKGKEKANVLAEELRKIMKTFQSVNPQLLQALNDPKVNVRLTPLQALDQISAARWKILLELQKAEPESRDVLKTFNAPDPLAKVIQGDWQFITRLLKEDDERLRRAAMDFLELLGEQAEPALEGITLALRDPDHFVRWSAVRTLGNIAPKKISAEAVRRAGPVADGPRPRCQPVRCRHPRSDGAAGTGSGRCAGIRGGQWGRE